MSTNSLIGRQRIRQLMRVPLATLVVVAATACQSGAAVPTPSASADVGQPSSSAAGSASASSSALAANCLDPAVLAAFDEILDGNSETDPPVADVADAFEALTLDGAAADARDSIVAQLRAEPIDVALLAGAWSGLRANVAVPEC